jgi:hypothetical protein
MRQAVQTMMVVLFLVLWSGAPVSAAATDAAGTIAQAKRLVEARNYSQAATLLEDILAEADARQRRSILDLLHQSYEAMAREAKAAGNDREAAHFLDNVAIIDKTRGPAAAPAKSAEVKPMPPAVAPKPQVANPQASAAVTLANPLPEPPQQIAPAPAPTPTPALAPVPVQDSVPQTVLERTPVAEPATKPSVKTVAPLMREPDDSPQPAVSTPKPPAVSLADGDRLFGERRYDLAGRCYAALARENKLPAYRKQHWAYCRMVEVARRINLRPQSTQEWDEIAAEIGNIQRLAPNIWYGEYLRNKVAEVRRTGRRPMAKSDNLIVRASEPDEAQTKPKADPDSRRFPRLFGKPRSGAAAQPDAKAATASPSAAGETPLKLPGGSSEPGAMLALNAGAGNERAAIENADGSHSQPLVDGAVSRAGNDAGTVAWQTYETPNFRVFHQDARLAEAAGNAAEAVRRDQAKRWATPAAQRPWAPRCDVYLYPSGKEFARETKQPESSPGFSTMMCNGNRVVARRMNLRADHPLIVTAILPHEVTHVVLADLFTTQQIPRWADEGIAVLAEPNAEQETRAAELQEPLEAGRVFDLRKLMAMDYPAAKDWSLYYAQSVSLTRFLVERGAPEQFVQFVQNSQRDGIEGALRGTYGIASLAELQERWSEYARQRTGPVKEARRDPGSQPGAAAVR